MKNENTSKSPDKSRLAVIIAVVAVAVAAVVIAVILLSDGNMPAGGKDGTDTSGSSDVTEPYVSETEDATDTVTETETAATGTESVTQPAADGFTAVSENVTAKELTNLRSEPAAAAEIVGTLKNGETALRTGVNGEGWSRLEFSGQTVYAVTSYLTTDLDYSPADIPQADIVSGNTFTAMNDSVTAKELVNLRALPTTDSEIIGTLVSGDFLERTAVSDKGWSRLVFGGQTVYAVTSYLSNEVVPPYVAPDGFDAVDDEVTAKSETNLRTSPDFDTSEIVHTLKNGEYVRRVAVNPDSGWSRLEFDGQTVYAVSSYLEVKNVGE